MSKAADLHRMVLEDGYTCPFGVRAKELLESKGFQVNDHLLTTRKEVDDFKAKNSVQTTPLTFIDGVKMGGHDDLVRYFSDEE